MTRDPRQQVIIEEVREFAKRELRPSAREFDRNGGISREMIAKMASHGYLAASLPVEWGGLGLDPVYYGLFTEEIGKHCVSARSLLTVHTSLVGETLLRWGSPEQQRRWLPAMVKGETITAFALSEPLVGSDAKNITTSFIADGDSFILNGSKKWITFGHLADLFVVIAARDGKSTAFLVERSFAGVSSTPLTGLMAGRGVYLAEVHLNHVRVPAHNVLGKLDLGFEYVVNTALDHGRYSIAWAGVALAQAALEAMVTYSRQRSQFGEKLRSFQLIRGMIGDAVTKVRTARAIALRAGELRLARDPEAVIETTVAKYFSSKVAVEVASDSLQVHGGNGFTDQYSIERLYREAKVLEVIEGSSQIQQEIIASYGLNAYYNREKAI